MIFNLWWQVYLTIISFDDLMDKKFMTGYIITKYRNPMDLSVFFENLTIDFRYDKNNEKRKSFMILKMPNFYVNMK